MPKIKSTYTKTTDQGFEYVIDSNERLSVDQELANMKQTQEFKDYLQTTSTGWEYMTIEFNHGLYLKVIVHK